MVYYVEKIWREIFLVGGGRKMKVAVVDDERACREMMEKYLSDFASETGVAFETAFYADAESFLADAETVRFDLIFMDIKMPGTDGMTAARKLRERDKEAVLIFVTDMAKFAVEGYEVHAFNYVLKPVTYFEFKLKMLKAAEAVSTISPRILEVVSGGTKHYLDIKKVLYVEVINHKLTFHTLTGDFRSTGSLSAVEERIADRAFCRCNSCFLVNLQYVVSVHGGDCELSNGEKLRISQSKRKAFVGALANWLGGRL